MDIQFTAKMEEDLDQIAEDKLNWQTFLKDFWQDFFPAVQIAEKEAKVPRIATTLKCPECEGLLQKVWGGDGYFLGCSHYPECKYKRNIEEIVINKEDYAPHFDWDQKCPLCGHPMSIKKSRFGIFLGCSQYPSCKGIVSPVKKESQISHKKLIQCPAINCDGHIIERKSRFGKIFFSCSNFPSCDVSANSLEEVKEKYKDYPKTPYKKEEKEKKAKFLQPSENLAKIIGNEKITRGQATKKLWQYIKSHNLQDKHNKRLIMPDSMLKNIIGENAIDMLQLASYLSKHLS